MVYLFIFVEQPKVTQSNKPIALDVCQNSGGNIVDMQGSISQSQNQESMQDPLEEKQAEICNDNLKKSEDAETSKPDVLVL